MGTPPMCTTCSSASVLWASSTALRAASSASSEPSVASRILVGKVLIAMLSFPLRSCRHPIEGSVLIVSIHWFVTRERRWHDAVSEGLQRLIQPSACKVNYPKLVFKMSHSPARWPPYGRPETSWLLKVGHYMLHVRIKMRLGGCVLSRQDGDYTG